MKTIITETKTKFNPIDISIRIESIEELKQLLIVSAVLSEQSVYDVDELKMNGLCLTSDQIGYVHGEPKTLATFIKNMIDNSQWQDLRTIYENCVKV